MFYHKRAQGIHFLIFSENGWEDSEVGTVGVQIVFCLLFFVGAFGSFVFFQEPTEPVWDGYMMSQ
jgi:hypothetical protein